MNSSTAYLPFPLESGTLFAGRYRVERIIGRGGMGFVYAVEHIGIRQQLALKVLNPALAEDEGIRQGFELEASVFGRIRSRHVVRPLDVGFDDKTRCHFLTMELLEGKTLEGLVRTEGPLAPARALRVLRQVAAGLDAAHGYRDGAGVPTPIVHRDLKPANIFVVHPDAEPLVKVLDFGLAKVLTESADLSREVKGTCAYMSSEQANQEPSYPQTDIWALGLVAYYVLTDAAYWRSTRTKEILAEILARPLPKASVRLSEQGLKSSLPEAFDDWLGRCLHRDPDERFRSAGVAIGELASLLESSGVDLEHPAVLRFDPQPSPLGPLELTQTRPTLPETDLSLLASACRLWSDSVRPRIASRLGSLAGVAFVLGALVGFVALRPKENREPKQQPGQGASLQHPTKPREIVPDAPAAPAPREAGVGEHTPPKRVPAEPAIPAAKKRPPAAELTNIKTPAHTPPPTGDRANAKTPPTPAASTRDESMLPRIPLRKHYTDPQLAVGKVGSNARPPRKVLLPKIGKANRYANDGQGGTVH